MKTKVLFVTIMCLMNTIGMKAQVDFISKFSDNESITSIFISKSLISSMANKDGNADVDFKKLEGKIDQIEIYKSNDNASIEYMKKIIKSDIAGDKSYELLMNVKDKNSQIFFHAKKEGDLIKDLIMSTSTGPANVYVIIRIKGNFTTIDMEEMGKLPSLMP